MKKLLLIILLFISSMLYAQEMEMPSLTGPVVDTVKLLTPEQVNALTAKSIELQKSKGSQIAVCIVPTTAPLTIEEYGIRLGEKWKIGREKIADGVIIIVAKNDRKMRIEVGRGLEGIITDLYAGRIVDNIMKPDFKKGNFYKGIDAAMDALITFINGGDIPGISSGSSSAALTQDSEEESGVAIGVFIIFASIIIFFIIAAARKILISIVVTYILLFIGLYVGGAGMLPEVGVIAGMALIPFAIIALVIRYG